MKAKQETSKSLKLLVIIISLLLMFTALVVVSYAWYLNINRADTSSTQVSSSTTPSIYAEIPDAFTSTELYSGQTGIEYGTEDMPYVLEYTPVIAEARYLPNDEYYMKAEVCGINIKLSEKDTSGNNIIESYDLYDEEGIEMMSHFTYRLKLTKILNEDKEEIATPNLIYKPQSEFLVTDDSNESPLNLVNGNFYYFDLQIIFQSEEGYTQLMENATDISSIYTFPLSDPKYMFSKMSIFFRVGLDTLYHINLNKNGGTCTEDYITTTGAGVVELPSPTKENAEFAGWYYDSEFTNMFTETSLKDEPIENDITIYAKYNYNVTFDYNEPTDTQTSETVTVDYNTLVEEKTAEDIQSAWNEQYDYEFVGWKESGASDYFDFSQPITEPVTLIGQWRQKSKIKVTLNTKRSTASISAKISRYDSYDGSTVVESYQTGESVTFYISDNTSLDAFLSNNKDEGIFRSAPTSGLKEFNKWEYKDGISYYDVNLTKKYSIDDGDIVLYADYSL